MVVSQLTCREPKHDSKGNKGSKTVTERCQDHHDAIQHEETATKLGSVNASQVADEPADYSTHGAQYTWMADEMWSHKCYYKIITGMNLLLLLD